MSETRKLAAILVATSSATEAILDKSAPAAPPSASAPVRSLSHLAYVDALRVVLIMLVVAHHSVEAYVKAHPPEIPLPDPPIARASVFLGVNAAFFMGLFFFLAGYFSPGAFDRKGAIDFLRDRGRRLGLPLLFGTFAIVPIAGRGPSRPRSSDAASQLLDLFDEVLPTAGAFTQVLPRRSFPLPPLIK